MAGYSGTSLAQKLGFKQGTRVCVKNAPPDYLDLVASRPAGVAISDRLRKDVDVYHFFTASRKELESRLPVLIRAINQDGAIWVSWPKKSSGVHTDITEGAVRDVALPLGLVDVKVCAVDETWSGLKLVIRRALRQ